MVGCGSASDAIFARVGARAVRRNSDGDAAAEALLAALRARIRDAVPGDAEQQARAMVRREVLRWISGVLQAELEPAVLVKGAALAMTHYEQPWHRPMSDIDLLVVPEQQERVVAALQSAGAILTPILNRPWTTPALGERHLVRQMGAVTQLIEVHRAFDKIVPRPVDTAAILTRGTPATDFPQLIIPCAEDQFLLVALHAAFSDFQHPNAWVDLSRLLERRLDWAAVLQRAEQWRMQTALYVVLESLNFVVPGSLSTEQIQPLRPNRLRRRWILSQNQLGSYPRQDRPKRQGLAWMVGQTPMRDDLAHWGIGLMRYAVQRALERGGLGAGL